MDRMKRSNIVIEGNSLTASVLAYFLSLYNENETITLINIERDEQNIAQFTPGIIMPIFQLNKQYLEKIYERTIIELKDIQSISQTFELSNNPLILLYRGKEAIKLMEKHREKLESSTLNYRYLSLEDIRNYYPFFNTEDEQYITEIYNSYSCSNIGDLIFTFRKLAKENDVEIINTSDDISFDQEKECFKTDEMDYSGDKLNILTSASLIPNLSIEERKIMKILTPVLEKFPKISMYNKLSDTMIWLEEAGYLHIHRMFNQISEEECLNKIKDDFEETFPLLGELQIADHMSTEIKSNFQLENSVGKMGGIRTVYFSLPMRYELSMIPALAIGFSRLVENRKYLLKDMTIEELVKDI